MRAELRALAVVVWATACGSACSRDTVNDGREPAAPEEDVEPASEKPRPEAAVDDPEDDVGGAKDSSAPSADARIKPTDARVGPPDAAAQDASSCEPRADSVDCSADDPPEAPPSKGGDCSVGAVPDDVRTGWKLSAFYKQYASAGGVPIVASEKPPASTLTQACNLVNEMVSKREDVRQALIENHTFFTIIAMVEKTTDTPEYSNLPDYYNTRARGLGGNPGQCAEESITCDKSDRWFGESICVHEYSHTISLYGLYTADKTFEARLKTAYKNAMSKGLWANTYAAENEQEYWGEGVQNWYYTNLTSERPNGVHGPIDTREELKEYDPELYGLISEWLPDDVKWDDCYRHGG